MMEIKRAYKAWCKATFPDYKSKDFPCHGRMFEVWCAAWHAAIKQGESK